MLWEWRLQAQCPATTPTQKPRVLRCKNPKAWTTVNTSIPACGYDQPKYELIHKYLAIEGVHYCHVLYLQYLGPVSSWYCLLCSNQGLRLNTVSQWFFDSNTLVP